MSVPLHQEKYQPFGDLWLEFADHDSISEFRRELDIANAICRTTYMTGGKRYTREYLISYPIILRPQRIPVARARGGFELDFEWDEGKLTDLKVKSVSGMPLFLNYNGFKFSSDTKKGEVLHFDGQLNRL